MSGFRLRVLSLALVLALVSACDPKPVGPDCANRYFPVEDGARWEYALEGYPTTEVVIEVAFVFPESRGFATTETLTADGVTQQTAATFWRCGVLGLEKGKTAVVMEPGGALPSPSATERYELTVPRDMRVGQFMTSADEDPLSGVTFAIQAEVIGQERLEVPAGSFEAAKISRTASYELPAGAPQDIPDGSSKRVSWYARDIGLVSESDSSASGGLVLVSYFSGHATDS